jgi:hypothetical protein
MMESNDLHLHWRAAQVSSPNGGLSLKFQSQETLDSTNTL